MSTAEARKIDPREVEKRFTSPITQQPPQNVQLQYEQLHNTLMQAAVEMTKVLPPGRETSLALTKIEEAQHWAYKAFAVQNA